MSERTEKLLKQFCLVLALTLVYPVARLLIRDDGLKALPTMALTSATAAVAPQATNQPPTQADNPGNSSPTLPESVRVQVETITQSEILGPLVRPQPLALIGIAGRDVFLRSANGRTGLLRAGESLDGIKLIRIGTNRVLIEERGKQRELTLFSGLGSKTLIPPTQKEKP